MGTPPPPGRTPAERKIEEYWSWAAIALYLLIPLDLLTTLYATAAVGVGGEANPLVAWLVVQPVPILVGINLGAVVLAATFFYGVMETYRRTPSPYDRYYGTVIETWLGVLVAAGLVVFANNLSVIVLGESLLG